MVLRLIYHCLSDIPNVLAFILERVERGAAVLFWNGQRENQLFVTLRLHSFFKGTSETMIVLHDYNIYSPVLAESTAINVINWSHWLAETLVNTCF